ncbi:choline ABC transporter substrate-binding protein [Bermanella marisrubri]|uniref:Putative glycine betaine-binding ABC transporter n=1 Tax=Bermanella marisrubri TaxID=207949 RepID=Q1N654_9GAMM|nr:choline ABC transporter substrate-binding protein [Bermanella marisrubri]EAT13738.1 putative glycine betaine-binding ABC transporter [Oceanobacter sp. RED65] [Bermanella marisrubri]QIZ84514.1 choline ABC transporter substrate-binding protein [Bermanella marisrubri]
MRTILILAVFALIVVGHSAYADEQCDAVRFGVVDWTDVKATTAVAAELLRVLGYEVEITKHSVPDTYEAMANNEVDIFLGNWMPSMAPVADPFVQNKQVERVRPNLKGAKYTLAVPQYVYDAGVTSFADIATFQEQFEGRIYGLEKGNDGNQLILDMIESNAFGLKPFNLIETSERLMLAQVKGKIRDQRWIVFLAWAPHPMNERFDLVYLEGGDDYFGPNKGGATVYTNTRAGFASDCPNVAQFLQNLEFSVAMEGQVMDMILNQFVPHDRAARHWMYQNPDRVESWLKGVRHQNGAKANAKAIARSMQLSLSE